MKSIYILPDKTHSRSYAQVGVITTICNKKLIYQAIAHLHPWHCPPGQVCTERSAVQVSAETASQ